jgi:hypothetical protein
LTNDYSDPHKTFAPNNSATSLTCCDCSIWSGGCKLKRKNRIAADPACEDNNPKEAPKNTRQTKRKQRQHIVKSKARGEVICPKCGKQGQMKRRTLAEDKERVADRQYISIDHYKNPKWHGDGFLRTCYIGKHTPELEAKIKADSAKKEAPNH